MRKSNRSSICLSIIWAAVILAAAVMLKDTPYGTPMLLILSGGAGATIVVLDAAQRKEENR